MGDRDGDAVDRRTQNDGRCVIGTAFELLDHVGVLEPVRLVDLAEATGIPGPTVHRLLSTDCGRRWLPGTHQLRRGSGSPGQR